MHGRTQDHDVRIIRLCSLVEIGELMSVVRWLFTGALSLERVFTGFERCGKSGEPSESCPYRENQRDRKASITAPGGACA